MNKKSVLSVVRAALLSISVIIAMLLAALAIQFIVLQFGNEAVRLWLNTPLGLLTLTALTFMLATLFLVGPLFMLRRNLSAVWGELGVTKRWNREMLVAGLKAWLSYFAVSVGVSIILYAIKIPGLDLGQPQQIGFQNLTTVFELVAAFVALVVLAPVFEELIFRGYLFGQLRARSGYWLSAILTSVTFAALHNQWNVAIDVFVLSLFLCYLRERFSSIWPGVLVHALKNSIAYTLLFILPLFGVKVI